MDDVEKVSAEIAVLKTPRSVTIGNTVISLSLSIFGGLGFVLELGLLHFPITNLFVFLFSWLIFPIIITSVAIYRNRLLEKVFNRVSSNAYLGLSKFWITFNFINITAILATGVFGIVNNNLEFKLLPLILLGFLTPFYFVFQYSLTFEGEIRILFENLLSNLDHFSKRNIFWNQIAEKIERLLEKGNIEISKDDLTYHFNAKLWQTKDDITPQLKDIESWLLDRQSSCFDSITKIVPAECFKAGKRKSLWRNIVSEPTTAQIDVIKILAPVIIAIIFAIIIIIHPEFGSQIISHFPML